MISYYILMIKSIYDIMHDIMTMKDVLKSNMIYWDILQGSRWPWRRSGGSGGSGGTQADSENHALRRQSHSDRETCRRGAVGLGLELQVLSPGQVDSEHETPDSGQVRVPQGS
jgi:hypothetical protein